MINEPTEGLDPRRRQISPTTPDKPGIFLAKKHALDYLKELPHPERYKVIERGIRALHWNMSIWIAVPKKWQGRP
jgi:hypothetical protein